VVARAPSRFKCQWQSEFGNKCTEENVAVRHSAHQVCRARSNASSTTCWISSNERHDFRLQPGYFGFKYTRPRSVLNETRQFAFTAPSLIGEELPQPIVRLLGDHGVPSGTGRHNKNLPNTRSEKT
jgi:hypothetical protein